MIWLRWFLFVIADIMLLPVWFVGAPIVSIFTRPEPDTDHHTWGGWFGTYDNPPQGDDRWANRTGFYPGETTGLKGYANRVGWIWRNPGYNFQRKAGVVTPPRHAVTHNGDEYITDKYRIPGWYFAKMHNTATATVIAWEFYAVIPYPFWTNHCLRIRFGYKIMTDKITELGFAPLVDSINPFKYYGRR